eukprot:gene16035-21764_t
MTNRILRHKLQQFSVILICSFICAGCYNPGLFFKRSLHPKANSIKATKSNSLYDDSLNLEKISIITTNSDMNVDSDNIIKYLLTDLVKQVHIFNPSNFDNTNTNSLINVWRIDPNAKKLDYSVLVEMNSIFLMFEKEGTLSIESENIRKNCRFTLFIPIHDQNIVENLAPVKRRLEKLVDKIISNENKFQREIALNREAGKWSHFLSLTYPSVDMLLPVIDEIRIGVDAYELRVDLLQNITTPSLLRQISLLQDAGRLPIVFTVRTISQIGKFQDTEYSWIVNLLTEGLRAGCEWIDVEASLPDDYLKNFTLFAKCYYSKTSKLLGSLHITTSQSKEAIRKMYEKCYLFNNADMLKVVTGASSHVDCEMVHEIGREQSLPYIGLCLGDVGSYSRVLNNRFTPVTHPALSAAAPGQLSVAQLMRRRLENNLITSKQFYLFGKPIQQSLSPAMHNNAFYALLLPHIYGLNEQEDVNNYKSVIESHDFGGASVTIPHKETIIPFLDEVRGAAVTIGAVNTIVPEKSLDEKSVKLVGYNTDWIGISRPISRLLKRNNNNNNSFKGSKGIGLVLGAGGTAKAACYAIKDLGFELVVVNRNPEKGQELADRFEGRFIQMEQFLNESEENNIQYDVIISTLPFAANITLPNKILKSKPVILDVVYKPAKTALIEQAINNDCLFVQGATMLLEQGIEQFELWNERRAPRIEMERAIFQGVEKL